MLAGVAVVLGAVTAIRAVLYWHRSERAMRDGRELPRSMFPVVLAGAVAVAGAAIAVVVLIP